MPILRVQIGIWLAILILSACSPDKPDETQKFYFLESMAQVENAGRQLQRADLKDDEVRQALAAMDEGIKLAFLVKAEFLDQFDPRLSKNYQRYFVKGVEAYRLGIEAGDVDGQKSGLQLLSQWANFWNEVRDVITSRMESK